MAERRLTAEEIAVVKLVADTVGAHTVSAQVDHARVTEERRRGGIFLTIEVPPTEVTAHGAATGFLPPPDQTASLLDDNGQPRGGVLLWLDDGLLMAVEVYDGLEEGEEVPFPERTASGSSRRLAGDSARRHACSPTERNGGYKSPATRLAMW